MICTVGFSYRLNREMAKVDAMSKIKSLFVFLEDFDQIVSLY